MPNLFPSTVGPLTQRQLYRVLTDPTLFELKRTISVIQEPILLQLESHTARQYLQLQEALVRMPL
jgi:hypothetical protein